MKTPKKMEKIDLVGLVSEEKIGGGIRFASPSKGQSVNYSPEREKEAGMEGVKLIEAHKDSEYAKYLVQHTRPAVN